MPFAKCYLLDIDKWGIADVSDWLKGMMLEQYIEVFRQNEISGPIVLDISLEDLDYMGVAILAHRKVLLKAIEDLRQNKRVTMDISAPQQPSASKVSSVKRTTSDPDILKTKQESKAYEVNK